MKFLNLLSLIILFGLTSLFANSYIVEEDNSMVTFKIRHALVAKVEGKFNEFSGSYEYDDALKYFISFDAEVKMNSIDTDDKYRDEHLKSKIFETKKYPAMSLKLLKQNGSSFLADLTIKDITKSVDFTISLVADSKNKFILSGEISRKDFALKFSDAAAVGGLVVGDKVEINILFVGV